MRYDTQNKERGFIGGVVIGGSLLYLLDPDKCGRRRRMLIRDKVLRMSHESGQFLDKTVRDLQNRARGIAAETWAMITERQIPDEVLAERVYARIGRVVSHPRALRISVRDGVVELRGPILEHELERALSCVRGVRGVRGIDNHLEAHKAGDISSLQGGSPRESRPEIFQERWAPATRAIVGLGGLGLLSIAGSKRRLRLPLGMAGGALLVRALTNMPVAEALGFTDTPNVIHLRKTVHINAPVEEVYEFFANPENLPLIFEHVQEVRHSRDNMYHWRVAGPAGTTVSWEAVMSENVPNERIAWSSLPGEALRTSGVVRFERNNGGGTTVNIQMMYKPPAGILGHAVASLFGVDPKHALDDDMVRLKSLMETGKTTAHHHRITKEEMERNVRGREQKWAAGGTS
jgi:uncharacterized membrane protein